jgi:RHS repeat-associated protein
VSAETLFTRGYTGHEHLDDFGLINMNGRVYDPRLARFLCPIIMYRHPPIPKVTTGIAIA